MAGIMQRLLFSKFVVFVALTAHAAEIQTNSVEMEFVLAPAGEFTLGATDDDREAEPDERPVRRVTIALPLWIGRHEVTQGQYQTVMGENPSWFSPAGGGRDLVRGVDHARLPVDMVSWFDAVEFCRRLSTLPVEKEAGRRYRLPAEAEWECAARAGTTTRFAWGDELRAGDANVRLPGHQRGTTLPVGSLRANAWGLFDMHGNVWEWCADEYHYDAYRLAASGEKPANNTGTGHVVRGGDWRSPPSMARSAHRDFTRATRRDMGNGFRVVLELRE